MHLVGKTALITGGASGIGLAMARRFAAEGAAVALVDRNPMGGGEAVRELQAGGAKAHFIEADLLHPSEIERAVQETMAACGRLDILVNNAGVILPKATGHITVAEWDWLMAIDLRAPFLLVQAALPALKTSRGNVLNISSTAALRVFAANVPYITAKGGLIAMTKSLAVDLHPYGVRVNCLCPGGVDTPLVHQDRAARGRSETELETLKDRGFLLQPEQVAAAALHLVSDEGSAITGSVLVVDGGSRLF
jgi:NAD(P)-dependent dehydrogenase (short-subunit alcohol dehydrogenase family)